LGSCEDELRLPDFVLFFYPKRIITVMKKLVFNIEINASREKIWDVLWNDRTYRIWTSVFSDGSYAVSDWEEGGKVQFLDGENNGMYGRIEKNKTNEFMSFLYLGEIKDGNEIPSIDLETKGVKENYTLEESGNSTKLIVELDSEEKYQDYFEKQFPQALQKVKELAEK